MSLGVNPARKPGPTASAITNHPVNLIRQILICILLITGIAALFQLALAFQSARTFIDTNTHVSIGLATNLTTLTTKLQNGLTDSHTGLLPAAIHTLTGLDNVVQQTSTAIAGLQTATLGLERTLGRTVMVLEDITVESKSTVRAATALLTSLQATAIDLNTQTTRTGDSMVQIAADLRPVLANAASITAHTDEATGILFRRDALPAQLLGVLGATKVTMGETAQTMLTIRNATPPMLKTWQDFGVSTANSAASLDKLLHPHWYDRALGWGVNGAILYREIHPEVSIPQSIIQFKSSRP